MKSIHVAILYLLVTACFALVAYLRMAPQEPSPMPVGEKAGPEKQAAVAGNVVPPELIRRLELLEKRQEEVAQALNALAAGKTARPQAVGEGGAAGSPTVASSIPSAQEALTKTVEELSSQLGTLNAEVAALRKLPTLDSKAGHNRIESVVQDEITRFAEQRKGRRRSFEEMIADEVINQFAARAGLSDAQLAGLYPHLGELKESERNVYRAIRRGEIDIAEAREAMGVARARMDEEARKVLDEEQYKAYQEEMKKHFGGPHGLFR